jgi:hypothetical protein
MYSHGPAPAIKIAALVLSMLVGLGLVVLAIRARGIGFYRRAPALVVFISLGTTGALLLLGYLAGVDVRGPAVLIWVGGSLIALVLFCYGSAQRFTRARGH